MTGPDYIEFVRSTVERIGEISRDYEAAYAMENDLFADVLRVIAEGRDDAADLAREAIKSRDIRFPRYTA